VRPMRTTFHAELDELMIDLARMARLAAQSMTNASIALHQNDLALVGLVIADGDQVNAMHNGTERRCVTLLALQAPVAGDLRVVIAALHASGALTRMANLARHIAVIARLKHPNPMIASEVCPVLALMGLLASQLAEDAATAIEHQDPLSGCRLAVADDELDALRRHLFTVLFADAEALMAGDGSALLGVFGWSVVLVAAAIATVCFRFRAGPWPTWALAVPVLVAVDLVMVDEMAALLPNLL
jgi:phosphate transport system protein